MTTHRHRGPLRQQLLTPQRIGFACCTAAMAILGGSVPVTRALLAFPNAEGQILRYAIAATVLFPLAVHARWRRPPIRGTDWIRVAVIAACGLVVFNYCLLAALHHGDPAVIATVLGCAPIALGVLSPLLRGQPPTARILAAASLVVAGTALLNGPGHLDRLGLVYAITALAGDRWLIGVRGNQPPPAPPKIPSAKAITAWIMRPYDKLNDTDRLGLKDAQAKSEGIAAITVLAHGFTTMVRQHGGEHLQQWLTEVEQAGIPELRSFATGLGKDYDAVRNGLLLAYSSGAVEGAITRDDQTSDVRPGKTRPTPQANPHHLTIHIGPSTNTCQNQISGGFDTRLRH